MNSVQLQGRLIKTAILTGEGKVLKFILSCKYRFVKDGIKEGNSTVPCIIFDPSTELREALNGKSTIYMECSGRVSRSCYEKPDGEKLYSTEIIIDPVSLILRKQ